MNTHHRLLQIVLSVVMMNLFVEAQEAGQPSVNYGIKASWLIAQGNSGSATSNEGEANGYAVAVFLEKHLGTRRAWVIRGELGFLDFGKYSHCYSCHPDYEQWDSHRKSAWEMNVGCMYHNTIQYLPYLFVGIGIGEETTPNYPNHSERPSLSGATYYGVGWKFTHNLGIEIKHRVGRESYYQVSALFRF